jgi:hypothetical protein
MKKVNERRCKEKPFFPNDLIFISKRDTGLDHVSLTLPPDVLVIDK